MLEPPECKYLVRIDPKYLQARGPCQRHVPRRVVGSPSTAAATLDPHLGGGVVGADADGHNSHVRQGARHPLELQQARGRYVGLRPGHRLAQGTAARRLHSIRLPTRKPSAAAAPPDAAWRMLASGGERRQVCTHNAGVRQVGQVAPVAAGGAVALPRIKVKHLQRTGEKTSQSELGI